MESEWIENKKKSKTRISTFDWAVQLFHKLLKKLRDNELGVNIGNKWTTNLGFADDTILMAESAEDMQSLSITAEKVTTEKMIRFNANNF